MLLFSPQGLGLYATTSFILPYAYCSHTVLFGFVFWCICTAVCCMCLCAGLVINTCAVKTALTALN
jgi:hypothetical protein